MKQTAAQRKKQACRLKKTQLESSMKARAQGDTPEEQRKQPKAAAEASDQQQAGAEVPAGPLYTEELFAKYPPPPGEELEKEDLEELKEVLLGQEMILPQPT